jgi:hypothetical protein
MDKVDYLEKANRQLTDERFYKKLDSDPTEEFSTNSCSASFSAGVRLLWVDMFVLVAVWTSFLTKSIKDSKVVFLLGFGIHELYNSALT